MPVSTLTRSLVSATVLAGLSSISPLAHAAGTAFDTLVTTSYSLSYTGNGINHVVADEAEGKSFRVGRMVDVVVTEDTPAQMVDNGAAIETVFQVTNVGNSEDNFEVSSHVDMDASKIASVERLVLSDDGSRTPVDATGLNLAADEQARIIVRVNLIPGAEISAGEQVPIILLVTSGYVNRVDYRTGDPDPVYMDGSGTFMDEEGDGAYSSQSSFEQEDQALSISSKLVNISDEGAGCGDPATPPTGRDAIPGACMAYIYTFQNADRTIEATDIDFEVSLSPHVIFRGWFVDGLVGGTETAPAVGAKCDQTSCTPSLSGASLAAGASATITAHVSIQ